MEGTAITSATTRSGTAPKGNNRMAKGVITTKGTMKLVTVAVVPGRICLLIVPVFISRPVKNAMKKSAIVDTP